MEPIDRFAERYLVQWDRTSTVRSTKRYVLTPEMAGESFFPPVMQPLCDAPAVVARGPEARRFVLVQSCYDFMNEIALLESDVVSRLSSSLAHRAHRVAMSEPVRHVALTVGVDEMYHSLAAREFIGQVRSVTGIVPVGLRQHSFLERAVDATLARFSDELHDDVRVIAVCIAENSITAEILGYAEGTTPDDPFHIVSEEHLVDERRHSGFFLHVLKHYWAGLDDAERDTVGLIVPAFVQEFLDTKVWGDTSMALLRATGLDASAAEQAFRDAFRPMPRCEFGHVRNVMRVLERSGILAHAPTREALADAKWIAA